MSLQISQRHKNTLQSEIRSMSIACSKLGGINLAQGICDTPVPEPVQNGAIAAIKSGTNSYTRYDGKKELREAIAAFYQKHYSISLDPEHEIIVSAGATGAMYSAMQALFDPGDEIIVFEPYYGYHINTLHSLSLVPLYIKLALPDWTFSIADLDRVLTSKTRAIIINTPGNPSGKVFSYSELVQLATFAEEHDLFIFTDEIYEHFLYDGKTHIPPMSLPGMRCRTITIGGFSKTFSITGWRIGYCICHPDWAQTIGYLSDLVYVCAPAPLQMGCAAGLNELPSEYYHSLSSIYQLKRSKICTALDTAGLTPIVPQGSYYVLADISNVPGNSSPKRALTLLEQTGIASVPGCAFYHDASGDTLARFCFAKDDEVLDEVCRRLEARKR